MLKNNKMNMLLTTFTVSSSGTPSNYETMDDNGNIIKQRTENTADGTVNTQTTYSPNGELISTTTILSRPDGSSVTTEQLDNGRLTVVTESDGVNVTSHSTTQRNADYTQTVYTVENYENGVSTGKTVTTSSPSGRTVEYFDANNNPISSSEWEILQRNDNWVTESRETVRDGQGNVVEARHTTGAEDGSSRTTVAVDKDNNFVSETTVVKNDDGTSDVTVRDENGEKTYENVERSSEVKPEDVVAEMREEEQKSQEPWTEAPKTNEDGSVTTVEHSTNDKGQSITTTTTTNVDNSKKVDVVVRDENGHQVSHETVNYNSDGKKTSREVSTRENGNTTTTIEEYDSDEKVTKTTTVTQNGGTKTTTTSEGMIETEIVETENDKKTTTTKYSPDGRKLSTQETINKGDKQYTLLIKYDEKGKEIGRTKQYAEYDENGNLKKLTTYEDGKTTIQEFNEDGTVTTTTKDSLSTFSSSYATKDDNTLASNLCFVSDRMHELSSHITPYENISYSASSDNEAGIIGAVYDAANYYGAVTNTLYSNLADEASAIYGIANLIFQMDQAASMLALTSLDDGQKELFSSSNPQYSYELEKLQMASNALASSVDNKLNSIEKYEKLSDFLGTTLSEGRVGKISKSALSSAVAAVVPSIEEEVYKSNQLSGDVANFLSGIDSGMLKGGVWDDVRTNLNKYSDMLKANEKAANTIMEALYEALGMIVDYLGEDEELDDSQIPEYEQKLKELEEALNAANDQLNYAKACPYMEEHKDNPEACPSISGAEEVLTNAQEAYDLCKKKLEKLKGLAARVTAAQKVIDAALNDVKSGLGNPTAYLESNEAFDAHLDLSEFGVDDTKDYKQILKDYYDKIKPTTTSGDTSTTTPEPTTTGDTGKEAETTPQDTGTDSPYVTGTTPTGTQTPTGSTPQDTPTVPTDPVTEAPTSAPTETPTEKPTEVPTMAPTEPYTEKPTEVPTSVSTEAPTSVPTTVPATETPTSAPVSTEPKTQPQSSKKKPTGGTGGGTNKKPKNPNVDPLENPSEPVIIDTQGELPSEPEFEEPIIDTYEEPIIDETPIEMPDTEIEIPTEAVKSGNGLKTMGIAAGVGLAVGASALGAHTIIKSKEDAENEDEDFGYEK